MQRIITALVLIVLLSLGTPAVAEEDRSAQARQQVEQTIAELDLTDEQIEQVRPVLQESMAAQREIMSSYGIDAGNNDGSAGKLSRRQAMSMRKELEAVRADTMGQLEGILNDEQLDEFKRIQEQRQAETRERIRESQ